MEARNQAKRGVQSPSGEKAWYQLLGRDETDSWYEQPRESSTGRAERLITQISRYRRERVAPSLRQSELGIAIQQPDRCYFKGLAG